MNLYISDTHFGHKGILRFDERPFFTIEEMEEELVNNWNGVVTKRDTVYVLGDFCWGKEPEWIRILNRLKGQKVLIKGNHDLKQISETLRRMFSDVKDYKEIKDGESTVIMSHYPILAYKRSYADNVWMLYGHVHDRTKESRMVERWTRELVAERTESFENQGHLINVGCMMPYMGYTPRTLEQLRAAFQEFFFKEANRDGQD